MKWLERLRKGLNKTSSNITKAFTHARLDNNALEAIEESLLRADIGSAATSEIINSLSKEKFGKDITSDEIKRFIAEKLSNILSFSYKEISLTGSPHVIMLCGVNGNGKTTTAGKIASRYKAQGKKVMLAACDTFRSAAVEQLQVWGERTGCDVISAPHGSDPASVAFEAMKKAKEKEIDLLIIDTAGRLQNKSNLMDELEKISRVLRKADPNAPHDTVIVIDATTGQNGISQVDAFHKAVNLTGIIITKLDGTAKGGILVSIAKKFQIPIMFIGVGETKDDINNFDPISYANGLLDIE
jgi:fused signal recognition particle receptor